MFRAKGGIALQGGVPVMAETLLAVARSSQGVTVLWVLHGLWLLANAAGLAFVPHVQVHRRKPEMTAGRWSTKLDILQSEHTLKQLALQAQNLHTQLQANRFTTINSNRKMDQGCQQLDPVVAARKPDKDNFLSQLVRLIQGVLDLAVELVVANEAAAVGALYPAVGRLANAAVAVLGPDLRLGSPAYVKTRALLRIAQVCSTN